MSANENSPELQNPDADTSELPQIGPLPNHIMNSPFTDGVYDAWNEQADLSARVGFEDYLLYNLQANGAFGPEKPLGYMPLGELTSCGPVAGKFITGLAERGMEARVFSPEECFIGGGAYYSYDRNALQAHLDSNQDTLQQNQWPTDVDGFVAHVATVLAPAHTPLFDVVADSFGDKDNPLRQG